MPGSASAGVGLAAGKMPVDIPERRRLLRSWPACSRIGYAVEQKKELMRRMSLMMSRCSELVSIDGTDWPESRSRWVAE